MKHLPLQPNGCARVPGLSLGLVGLLTLGTVAGADDVVLTPVKDNTLFSLGTTSNGAGDAVFSGRTGPSGGTTVQRAVLAFDIADAIPPGATIISASLTLTLIQVSPFGAKESHTLHRILADWGEGASFSFGGTGAPAAEDDATWLHTYFPDQFWASPGGDFVSTTSASETVGVAFGEYTWDSTPVMVADVQGWLNAPETSFGWLVMGNETGDRTSKKFVSKDSPDVPARPRLTIEYLPPPCPWDCDDPADGEVNIVDFLALLAQWGQVGVSCDLDGGGVSITDFLKMLAAWGTCP